MTYYPGLYDGAMVRGLKTYNGPKSYSYNSPSPYNNSIFCKCPGQTQQTENSLNALLGLTAVLGAVACIVPFVPSIIDFFKGSGSNNGKSNGADPGVVDANNSKGDLSKAVTEAEKNGNWQPVKNQYDTSLATYNKNEDAMKVCQTEIDKANEVKKTINDAIKELEAANDDIDKNLIPAAEKTRDDAVKASEGKIVSLETGKKSLETQRAAALANGQPTYAIDAQIAKIDEQIAAEKKNIETAKKECEKQKAQLGDKKKQNLTAIGEKQKEITKQDATINEQKTKQNGLKDANNSLKKELDEAKGKLELRDVNVEAAAPSTNKQPAGSDKNTNVTPANNEQPAASTETNVNPSKSAPTSEQQQQFKQAASGSSEESIQKTREIMLGVSKDEQIKKELAEQIHNINKHVKTDGMTEQQLRETLKNLQEANKYISFQ